MCNVKQYNSSASCINFVKVEVGRYLVPVRQLKLEPQLKDNATETIKVFLPISL